MGEGEEMEVDQDTEKMDVDGDYHEDLRSKMRQQKIDFALGRMEGANPLEHSAKEFNPAHE